MGIGRMHNDVQRRFPPWLTTLPCTGVLQGGPTKILRREVQPAQAQPAVVIVPAAVAPAASAAPASSIPVSQQQQELSQQQHQPAQQHAVRPPPPPPPRQQGGAQAVSEAVARMAQLNLGQAPGQQQQQQQQRLSTWSQQQPIGAAWQQQQQQGQQRQSLEVAQGQKAGKRDEGSKAQEDVVQLGGGTLLAHYLHCGLAGVVVSILCVPSAVSGSPLAPVVFRCLHSTPSFRARMCMCSLGLPAALLQAVAWHCSTQHEAWVAWVARLQRLCPPACLACLLCSLPAAACEA
jgi:hypothetical protein